MPQPPYPLHPSVADKLDPQYVDFYNKHIINSQQVHYQPVAASRVGGKIIPGGSDNLPVGETRDVSIPRRETSGPDVKVRCFVPEGQAPSAGWPVMIYYHGGGWVLGNIDTENTVCTNMCKRARSVVVTTDYRYVCSRSYAEGSEAYSLFLGWRLRSRFQLRCMTLGRHYCGLYPMAQSY